MAAKRIVKAGAGLAGAVGKLVGALRGKGKKAAGRPGKLAKSARNGSKAKARGKGG